MPASVEVVVVLVVEAAAAAAAGSEKDKRGTDDDVRLRMRHTAARLVWRPVVGTLARWTLLLCFFVAHGFGVRELGARTAGARPCYRGCSIEHVRQGLSSTWNRSTQPPSPPSPAAIDLLLPRPRRRVPRASADRKLG